MKKMYEREKWRMIHSDIVVDLHEDGTYRILKDKIIGKVDGEFPNRDQRIYGLRDEHRAWRLILEDFNKSVVAFSY